MSLADRLSAAVTALKGKQSTDQQTITDLRAQLAAALKAASDAQATATQAVTDKNTAEQALADFTAREGDETTLAAQITTLEGMAA